MYKQFVKSKDRGDYIRFKNKRAVVKSQIRIAKNEYYNKIFTNNNKKGGLRKKIFLSQGKCGNN